MKKGQKTPKQERLLGLFISELEDMLDGENQIVKGLPNLIKAVDAQELKDAFTQHLQETKEQVQRLDKIFRLLNTTPKRQPCEAMEGLIEECLEAVNEFPKSPLRDAAIIAKAQRIEHYEMSVYGTLRSFANELGFDEAIDLLQKNQDEEINADKTLSKLAEGGLLTAGINHKANQED